MHVVWFSELYIVEVHIWSQPPLAILGKHIKGFRSNLRYQTTDLRKPRTGRNNTAALWTFKIIPQVTVKSQSFLPCLLPKCTGYRHQCSCSTKFNHSEHTSILGIDWLIVYFDHSTVIMHILGEGTHPKTYTGEGTDMYMNTCTT